MSVALPCPSCAHLPVCAIRPLLEPLEVITPPAVPHEAIRVSLSLAVDCGHFLPLIDVAPVAPAEFFPLRPAGAAGGPSEEALAAITEAVPEIRQQDLTCDEPGCGRTFARAVNLRLHKQAGHAADGGLSVREAQIVQAIRDAGGDQAAAGRALGYEFVAQLTRKLRQDGRLPGDVVELIDQRKQARSSGTTARRPKQIGTVLVAETTPEERDAIARIVARDRQRQQATPAEPEGETFEQRRERLARERANRNLAARRGEEVPA